MSNKKAETDKVPPPMFLHPTGAKSGIVTIGSLDDSTTVVAQYNPKELQIDRMLSELDDGRRRALAEIVAGGSQTIITATAASALPGEPAQALAVTLGEVG